MTYTKRLLVLVAASAILTAIYFVSAMSWVMQHTSMAVGFLLPIVVSIICGSFYLAGSRKNNDGETVGYTRIVMIAVFAALFCYWWAWTVIGTVVPFLHFHKG